MTRFWIFLVLLVAASSSVQAAGFFQANQSAAAAGVANAFVATANDASAVMYNPAGLAWQDGISVTAGVLLNYRDSSVKLPAGVAPNDGVEDTIGQLYLSWMPHDGRIGAAFGFAPLYQVNNTWGAAFGTASGDTKINVDHASFDTFYALSSTLAIGGGADWYINRVTLTQGANSFKGNDFASFGGHVSVMWKPRPAWSVGAMLRSGANISVSGSAGDTFKMKLPDSISVGVAHDFADVWRLEGDLGWTRWSALKDMNVVKAGVISQANPLNLKDTLKASLGLTWTWREATQFRFGYAYDQGANKSNGFNPAIADQDGHQISLGAGGSLSGMHVDLSYSYTYYSKKTATGTYAGTYRDRRQALLLSISKRFE
ncbi:MAG: outer membrane protein transport protein [Mariprofundaceae bacterium]